MADFSNSPLAYMGVRGPEPASYQIPTVDFSWLGNLADAYQKGQQYARQRELQTMFQPGTPGAKALEEGGIDPNSLPGQLIRAGGAPMAEPFAQRLMQQQIFQNILRSLPNMPAGPSLGPTSGAEPTSAGPNDNVALLQDAIYGQESGHGRNTRTSETGNIGPMQISKPLFQEHARPGENIYNAQDNKAVGDRILASYMQKYNGDWARAAVAYYSGEGNVSPPGSPTPWKVNKTPRPGVPGPSVAGYVRDIGARMAQARGAGQPAIAGIPAQAPIGSRGTGTSAPAPAGDLGVNANVAEATGGPPFAPMLTASQSPSASGPANIRLASASGDLTGLITPPPRGEMIPPSAITSAGQGQGLTAGGPRDVVPQGPAETTQPGQITPPIQLAQANVPSVAPAPGQNLPTSEYTPERAAAYEKAARDLEDYVQRIGLASGASGLQVPTTDLQERIKDYQAKATEIRKFLGDRSQKQFDVGIEGQKEQQKKLIDRSEAIYGGLSAAERTYQADQKHLIDLSRGILNTPGIYTGIGGEKSHDWNKVRAVFGDTGPALLQDALQKITASSVLATINQQKYQMQEAGGNSSRIFSTQVDQVAKASPSLQTTVAGNRAL